jgi:hypothetical protein
MSSGGYVDVVWCIGFVVTWIETYRRAQWPVDWREFLFRNLGYFALTIVKVWFWPVTFIVWLATGRGPTRWRAVTNIGGRDVRKMVHIPPGHTLDVEED